MNAGPQARVRAQDLRVTFIHNPVSGKASKRGWRRRRVEEFVAQHRLNATVATTQCRGHATELARAAVADGVQLVVSVGGDGTMNEVAAGLVGTPALYGMIPTGSGNGLGRDLGLPLAFDRALKVLLDGTVRTIDTGVVCGHPFFNVMGLGFDAEVGRRFNTSTRRGLSTYVKIGVGAFFSYRKERVTVESDDGTSFTVDAFLACVANSTQYGNNARIAPRARLDDGRLDFVAVTTGNPVLALPMVVRLFTGSLHRSRYARAVSGTRFRIRRAVPGAIHTDGEIHTCPAEFEVSVRPQSLRVIVPRG